MAVDLVSEDGASKTPLQVAAITPTTGAATVTGKPPYAQQKERTAA